jgi:hypothetical protein
MGVVEQRRVEVEAFFPHQFLCIETAIRLAELSVPFVRNVT